jgi:glycosyltransferase 2 family protein
MAATRVLVLIGGVCLLGMLVISVGVEPVVDAFRAMSWWLLLVLVFPCVPANIFDTLGWRFAFPHDRVSFLTLWRARLAGEAVNTVTPTASVGGEAVKVWLLRPRVPYSEGFTAVVVAKTTITVAQGLFLLLGLLLVSGSAADSRLVAAMRWLIVVELFAVAGFIAVQVSGIVGGAVRVVGAKLGFSSALARAADVGLVEHTLRDFYTRRPYRLALSLGSHFVGWLLSAAELWVVLRLLGVEISPTSALILEAFATGIKFVTFFVPAGVGTIEGGLVLIFVAFGFGAPLGLAFALVRRFRELCWTATGLIVLMAMGGRMPTRDDMRALPTSEGELA